MKMKKAIMLFLTVLLTAALFMGCEDATGSTTSIIADDGFGLVSSNIAFNSSTSVSILSGNDTSISGDLGVDFYAPKDLDELEGTDASVLTFTFNESLDSNSIDAVFGLVDEYGDASTTPTNAKETAVWVEGSALELESVTVSGATVKFTLPEDSLTVDDEVIVYFGVASAKGEYYQVVTAFQPKADVTTSMSLTSDFSDYFAYAIDSDKVFVLDLGETSDHIADPVSAESIMNVTIPRGIDFGNYISTLSLRATNTDAPSAATVFQHLQDLEDDTTTGDTAGYVNFITLEFDPVENATDYVIYRKNDNTGSSYEVEFVGADPDNGNSYLMNISFETDDEGNILTFIADLYFEDDPIVAGDYIEVVPVNSRGEFTEYAATYDLVDTVQPYAYTTLGTNVTVDVEVSTPVSASGPNYSDHDQTAANGEGHLYSLGSFAVQNPTAGTPWSAIEGIEIAMTGVAGLTASTEDTVSEGGLIAFTRADALELFDDDFSITEDDFTIMSNTAGNVWACFNGTTVYIYAGYKCNVTGLNGGISYASQTWKAVGNFTFSITDMSGNQLMFEEADSGSSYANGSMTIELQ